MEQLLQTGKYGANNASDPTTIVYYIMKYFSYEFESQEDIIAYGRVIKAGELVVRS